MVVFVVLFFIELIVGVVWVEKLGVMGKKKKWGLSLVFGGVDKSIVSLVVVDEYGYNGVLFKWI